MMAFISRSRLLASIVFVLLVKLDSVSCQLWGRGGGRDCSIKHQTIETLGYNTTSKSLFKLEDGYDKDTSTRLLLGSINDDGNDFFRAMKSDFLINSSEGYNVDEGEIKIVEIKRCTCATQRFYPEQAYYCPIESNWCQIPYRSYSAGRYYSRSSPICLQSASQISSFVRYTWLMSVLLFCVLFSCVFFTSDGSNAISYLISTICCISIVNKVLADRMLQNDPEKARHLIRNWCLRRRQEIEEEFLRTDANENDLFDTLDDIEIALVKQNEDRRTLLLKTRIYKSQSEQSKADKNDSFRENTGDDDINNDNEEEEDEEGASCTICFGPVKDGDRIGDLASCNHTFHVDCLKVWLKRRNVCPLCLETQGTDDGNVNAVNENNQGINETATNTGATTNEIVQNEQSDDEI